MARIFLCVMLLQICVKFFVININCSVVLLAQNVALQC